MNASHRDSSRASGDDPDLTVEEPTIREARFPFEALPEEASHHAENDDGNDGPARDTWVDGPVANDLFEGPDEEPTVVERMFDTIRPLSARLRPMWPWLALAAAATFCLAVVVTQCW